MSVPVTVPSSTKKLLIGMPYEERVMAWRIDFGSSEGLNILWALSPRATRLKIEQAHRRAAREAMAAVQIEATNAFPQQSAEKEPTALFAVFRPGNPADRLPDLSTTAFLFNLKFEPNGVVSALDCKQLQQAAYQLQDFYTLVHHAFVRGRIGIPEHVIDHDLRAAGISRALYSEFTLRGNASLDRENPRAITFRSREERFTHWQQQAQLFGWGTKQAEAYLRQMRRWYAIRDLMSKCHNVINRGIDRFFGLPACPRPVQDRRSIDPPKNDKRHDISHSH